MSIASSLASRNGIATLDELVGDGLSPRAVQRAAAGEGVMRIRRNWYASDTADRQVVAAIRAGGSLTCVTECARQGIWVPRSDPVHLAVTHDARRIKHPQSGADRRASDDVVIHWTAPSRTRESRGVLPLLDCLVDVFRCQDPEVAFAMVESAIHRNLLSRADRRMLQQRVVSRLRSVVEEARGDAESGTESLFRFRMLLLGVVMRSQVEIPGVGRVDFVIGDRLVIEIDSTSHHAGLASRLRDLQRDAILAGLGFLSLRFDYQQIVHDWETVVSTVLAVIARGEHLRTRSGVGR